LFVCNYIINIHILSEKWHSDVLVADDITLSGTQTINDRVLNLIDVIR